MSTFIIKEKAAYLIAVAEVMIRYNVSAMEARSNRFDHELVASIQANGIDRERALWVIEMEFSTATSEQ